MSIQYLPPKNVTSGSHPTGLGIALPCFCNTTSNDSQSSHRNEHSPSRIPPVYDDGIVTVICGIDDKNAEGGSRALRQ
jgi:hypothetical protein